MLRKLIPVVAAALLVSGCQAAEVPTKETLPQPTPFLGSEEQLLADVEEFMSAYLAALTQMTASSGAEFAGVKELTSATQFEDERLYIKELARRGLKFSGFYDFFAAEIQQFHQDTNDEAFVQAYVCIDYRDVSYTRADGSVYLGEAQWGPYEAIMTARRDGRITLDEMRQWTGRDFCAGRS